LFVRAGVTSATVTASSRYGYGWSSGSDFSYGGGAQFNFTKNVYGQVDYMSYYNKNNVTAVAPSISVGYKF
jgi:opacity protein-like surface antigen